jgi:hypothetical protein
MGSPSAALHAPSMVDINRGRSSADGAEDEIFSFLISAGEDGGQHADSGTETHPAPRLHEYPVVSPSLYGPAHGADSERPSADVRASFLDTFRRACALLDESPERAWAREFVFDSSPHVAAQMLTNPTTIPYASSINYVDTNMELDGKSGGAFDSMNHFDGIFVPTFHAEDLIVGVAATRKAASPGGVFERIREEAEAGHTDGTSPTARQMAPYTFASGRYVRHVHDGRFLMLGHEEPSTRESPSLTFLSCIMPVASTRVEYIFMIFDGETFRKGNIVDAVRFCVQGSRARFCPSCGAPPSAACGCKLPMHKPAHSLDFSRNPESMSCYPGSYLGSISVIAAFSHISRGPSGASEMGLTYSATSLVSNMNVRGFVSSDSQHNELASLFQSFTVQLSISDRSPTLAIMPAADGSSNRPGGDTDEGDHDASEERTPGGGPDGFRSTPCLEAACVGKSRLRPGALKAEFTETPGPRTRNSLIQVQIGGGAQKFHRFETHEPSIIQYCASSGMDRAETSAGLEQREQALRAPSEEVDAREMQRKLRNRESATRSNARRKERNAARRKGLAKATQQASELREREITLRAENTDLRRQLGCAMLPERKDSDWSG